MPKTIYTAIVFFAPRIPPHKYRNISNRPAFVKFAMSKNGWYINWYDKRTRELVERQWLREFV